ncbi:MAG: hypothetical protein QF632_04450 [Candidatus Woesearchaeota archaeon]|jgi:hypothetical protein|nr:hypothetical protein [Candidatus Woesearchaeota archaeon]
MPFILTDKVNAQSLDEPFVIRAHNQFFHSRFLQSMNGPCWSVNRYYGSSGNGRVLRLSDSLREEVGSYNMFPDKEVVVEAADPQKDDFMLFVNLPTDLNELSKTHPNAVIVCYAHNTQREDELKEASGIENPFILRYRLENQQKAIRLVHKARFNSIDHYFQYSGFKGIITEDNYEGIILETTRQLMFSTVDRPSCGFCRISKLYYQLSNRIEKYRGKQAVFEHSPLNGLPVSECPDLEGIPFCNGDHILNPKPVIAFRKKYQRMVLVGKL